MRASPPHPLTPSARQSASRTRCLLAASLRHFVTPSLLLLASCSPTEHVTHYKPFFTGIGEAQHGDQGPVDPMKGRRDPTEGVAEIKAVVENPDGSKTYIARAPIQLMAHVEALLDENTPEADRALLDQLIDERTKEHYRQHGQDPAGYVTYLHQNRKNIAKTFQRMPMGEHSPTVIVEQPGDRAWAITLTGQAAKDLKFTQVWVRQDMGQWRLEWLK